MDKFKIFFNRINDQFTGGFLIGAALATLIVSFVFYGLIETHRGYESELSKAYLSAVRDVETLQNQCGIKCKNIILVHEEKLNSGYWN